MRNKRKKPIPQLISTIYLVQHLNVKVARQANRITNWTVQYIKKQLKAGGIHPHLIHYFSHVNSQYENSYYSQEMCSRILECWKSKREKEKIKQQHMTQFKEIILEACLSNSFTVISSNNYLWSPTDPYQSNYQKMQPLLSSNRKLHCSSQKNSTPQNLLIR